MKKNYTKLILMTLSFFVLQTVVAQERLKDSNFKNASKVSEYLSKNKKKYNLVEEDIEDIIINKELYTSKTDVSRIYLHQTFKGIKIYNAISVVGIKNDKIFHFANKFKGSLANKISTQSPLLSMQQAIQKVASHFNLGNVNNLQILESKDTKKIFSKGSISQENIPVELVYFQLPDESLRLSWDLNIYTLNSKHWWSVRIDAVTGEILDITDWVLNCKFDGDHTIHGYNRVKKTQKESFNLFKKNVFSVADGSQYNVVALPAESPNHGPIQLVLDPADDLASPFGWHDTDGVAGADYTITRGNNVLAQDDLDDNDGTGSSPDGTTSLNFNFPIDLNESATNYLDGSITNLFYVNNMMHDIFYNHGFDEASGNFQANNYGNGGVEGDYVLADAHDGGGLNNANMLTPPDGTSPRMQMYLFNKPGSDSFILTINGGTLDGGYTVALPSTADGDDGPGNITRPNSTPVTADIVIVDDGTTIPEEGCSTLINNAQLSGKIAFIRRGSCNFTVKIQNAQDAGAVAVIVGNHNNPTNDPNYVDYVGMYGVTDPVFTIPSIFINYTDGQAIVDAIGNAETLNATIVLEEPFRLDGSLDNGIVAHEYGHGISIRLAGGASTSNCLTSNFQAGEGWSDWFALMVSMKASDIGTEGRGIGTYAFSQPVDGAGTRRRKYSTDFAINEYTYDDTNDNTQYGTDPDTGNPLILNRDIYYHGTIWATMIWDLTWAYIDKYGFDPNFFNGTGGNNRAMSVVIEGLKLQGCDAEYLEARDGILAADVALTGGEDQCLIWDVFARRGLGVNASEGFPISNEDQVADFNSPDSNDPSLEYCTTLSNDTFASKDYKIYPNPSKNKLTIKSGKNLGNVTIKLFDINGRQVLSKKATLHGDVILDVSNLTSGLYVISIKGDYIFSNEKLIIN